MLPTPASARLLGHLVSQGFTEAGKYAPPVPELTPMLLLAAGGIGIAALLTDWMAVRLGSAALAGLPLLLLFTEPFTLSVGRGFLGTTVAFCIGIAGYLALLSSEGKDRIREWESQDPAAGNSPDTKALAAAGRRVGFASVVVALILPLVIPGLHVTRLFGGQAGIGGRGGAGVSTGAGGVGFPGVDTQFSQQLSAELNTPAQIVLGYNTAVQSPDYLQLYVLDKLTDSGWALTQPESVVRVDPRLPAPPGLVDAALDGSVSTTVTIARDVGPDQLNALPAPYPTTTIKAKGNLEADRSTLMLFDQGPALGGLTYQLTSLINAPSEQALDNAPSPPAVIKDDYQEVPASYDSLRALADSIVRKANAKTPLDKAVALQNWLADGSFKYTLKAPTVLDATELSHFLTVTKTGYCQQFSFAMAVLARLVGIPSRVAYGFTSGSPVGDNEWQVTTHDAHAWPELYFSGFGWLRFEPTPSGPTGQGTAYAPSYATLSGATSAGTPGQSAPTAAPSSAAGSSANQAQLRHILREQLGDQGGPNQSEIGNPTPAAHPPGTNPWEVFGLVLAGLVILGLVAPWTARLAIRRRRWRPPTAPRPAGPGGRGVGARGLERAQGRPGRLRRGLPAERHAAGGGGPRGHGAGPGRTGAGRARPDRHGGGTGPVRRPADRRQRPAARQRDRAAGHRRRRAALHPVARQAAARLGDRPGAERNGPGSRHLRPPDPGVDQQVPGSGLLEAAFLSPAPALVEPFHHRAASRLAATAAPRTPRAALADGAVGRPAAKRDGGHLPPAVQRPDAAEQQDNEPADRQADQRQDDPDGNHRRAESQPNERLYHPTPVMHVGIAGAN